MTCVNKLFCFQPIFYLAYKSDIYVFWGVLIKDVHCMLIYVSNLEQLNNLVPNKRCFWNVKVKNVFCLLGCGHFGTWKRNNIGKMFNCIWIDIDTGLQINDSKVLVTSLWLDQVMTWLWRESENIKWLWLEEFVTRLVTRQIWLGHIIGNNNNEA